MALKIDASSLLSRHYLLLKRDGVRFLGSGMLWGARRFRFHEIGGVLMSADHTLSFQVGNGVFSIRTRPGRPKHAAAIAALLAGLEKSRPAPGSAAPHSP